MYYLVKYIIQFSQESFDLQLVTRNGHLPMDEDDRIYQGM